jgi:hypothetical protein
VAAGDIVFEQSERGVEKTATLARARREHRSGRGAYRLRERCEAAGDIVFER